MPSIKRIKKMSASPIQKILFGSPGTGKSYQIENDIAKTELGIDKNSQNYIATVFHPEYTYGDFMGKLMPLTNDNGKVEYSFYCGHFLKALAQAYKNIIKKNIQLGFEKQNADKADNVILVIDEINRGNSAAIFGTVFQLLDRQTNGWSSYSVNISDLEFKAFLKEMSFEMDHTYNKNGMIKGVHYKFDEKDIIKEEYEQYLAALQEDSSKNASPIKNHKIKIPPNLSIVASMNTSDNSIYFMDSAFKRRWEWEFVCIEASKAAVDHIEMDDTKGKWSDFVDKLNAFFVENHRVVRKIEDKQIGYFFIKANETNIITQKQIKNKLMFFVWDSVFTTDKKPLAKLLEIKNEQELVTFGQFTTDDNVKKFIDNIIERKAND
jgi:5-methylcytosine-specific restriction endonuclease McrBC GTP-binding regulatory subunit McrB